MITKRLKLDLLKLLKYKNTNLDFASTIEENENYKSTYMNAYGISITVTSSTTTVTLGVGGSTVTKTGNDILDISATNDYIVSNFIFDDQYEDEFLTLFKAGVFSYDYDGQTTVLLYRLNDERDAVNKSLVYIGYITGKFSAPLGIKNIELDVLNYNIDVPYNYVYIPRLSRYYYVTNIQLTTKDYTRLQLNEDVLMSWQDLIKRQDAYVTRYGYKLGTNPLLFDERYPVQDTPTVTNYTITNVAGSTIIQFKYLMDNLPSSTIKAPNVFYHAVSEVVEFTDNTENIEAPTGSGLPNIQSRRGSNHFRLMDLNTYNQLLRACAMNDAPASYIQSLMLLPFDLRDIFPDASSPYRVYAGNKMLAGGEWVGQSESYATEVYGTKKGGFPYIVVADFYFDSRGGIGIENNYLDMSSNTAWEIYLPFVGWVRLEPSTMYYKRIMVYYAIDFDTGLSTAYIYNRTDNKLLWSGNCQLGMKLPLAVTNAEELARQKQSTGLNLIMGILASALSIGVGAYSGNAVAVMGGIMGIGKTVASTANAFNQMIEKAQTTFGSSDNALFSPKQVTIRKITHRPLLPSTAEARYAHISGYPYKQYVELGAIADVEGGKYIEVGEIHFDAKGENIYSTEIDEIVALLKDGVIL